ncbi:hypothetical protein [Providencia sp. Me31A]|uniref:hypothetical protein n=1 Tax=Providencia sp. Me31A TaxID=3392637 RepID=UPI003D2E942B
MNKQIFIDKLAETDSVELMIQSIFTEDDIGAVLRIHLLCEQLSEAWICAACDANNFFGEGNYTIRMNCSDKFKLVKNLGLPEQLCSCLRIINKIRNNAAHQIGRELIPNESIDSLIKILREYKADNPSDDLSIDSPLETYNEDGTISGNYSILDKGTPNRIKLFICYVVLYKKIIFSIN